MYDALKDARNEVCESAARIFEQFGKLGESEILKNARVLEVSTEHKKHYRTLGIGVDLLVSLNLVHWPT